jgi:hypothetical protein
VWLVRPQSGERNKRGGRTDLAHHLCCLRHVLGTTHGIGAHVTNDEKPAHLTDVKREHLIDQVCIQEILPPGAAFAFPPSRYKPDGKMPLSLVVGQLYDLVFGMSCSYLEDCSLVEQVLRRTEYFSA